MIENLLWIVSGPTSVGKSTFMASARCAEITGLPLETSVVLPKTRERLSGPDETDALYHYNILRPLQLKRLFEDRGAARKAASIRGATDFAGDPGWQDLSEFSGPKRAVVLVAGKRTILERIRQREIVEDPMFANVGEDAYDRQWWLRMFEQVDLAALYRAWCQELRSRGIPYTLVDGKDHDFSIVEDERRVPELLSANGPVYTEKQIRRIFQKRKFEYHRVE